MNNVHIADSAAMDLYNQHGETAEKNECLIDETVEKAKLLGINDTTTIQIIIRELITAIETDEKSDQKSYISVRKNKESATERFLYLNPNALGMLQSTKEDASQSGLGNVINQNFTRENNEEGAIKVNIESFNKRVLQQIGIDTKSEEYIISSGQIKLSNYEQIHLEGLMKKIRHLREIIEEQQLDEETGLKNRDAFNDYFKDSLEGLEHHRNDIKTVSLITMSVDNSETIVDNLEKLREVAECFKRELRSPRDIVFRSEKSEFCLIMINQDKNGVDTLAKKLKIAAEKINISILVGTSGTYEQTMADCKIYDCKSELFSRAKQRQKVDKFNGKND